LKPFPKGGARRTGWLHAHAVAQHRSLTFARPGAYRIEALADGVAFARRELLVIAKAQAGVNAAMLAPSAS
jgi:hypothetical protein